MARNKSTFDPSNLVPSASSSGAPELLTSTQGWSGTVDVFEELPDALAYDNLIFLVRTTSGNYYKGFYHSSAGVWTYFITTGVTPELSALLNDVETYHAKFTTVQTLQIYTEEAVPGDVASSEYFPDTNSLIIRVPQGPAGPAGPTGIQGIVGSTGPTGNAGPLGPQGIQGPEGSRGPQGNDGVTGPIGPIGPQGLQGVKGPDGNDGPIGPTGDTGPQGIQGIQGTKGLTGNTGPQGLQGPQGSTGPIGPDGPQGIQGTTGLTGPQGITGNKGPTGDKGLTGDKGPDGNQGPLGLIGPQGPDGLEGPQGPVGVSSVPLSFGRFFIGLDGNLVVEHYGTANSSDFTINSSGELLVEV